MKVVSASTTTVFWATTLSPTISFTSYVPGATG
jgi:hypothetical protein